MPILTLAQAEDLVATTLERCATSPDNAGMVARALVAAQADGLAGHGLVRLPAYAAQARSGKVDGFAVPSATRPRPGIVRVDAAHGFAFPALALAETHLRDMAGHCGIACAAITRSHHCGAAGHPVERLAREGLVAFMFANTPAAIAPWGGSKALFGTNPIAFACPVTGAAPIVIDLSLSKVARGNIVAARHKGEAIPPGWALDREGLPTTDPEAALAGTMLPLGDAKGAVLALMVELLAAGLPGANFAAQASSFLDAEGPPPGTGQLMVVLDGTAFGAASDRFAALAHAVAAQGTARLPGARRLAARTQAQRHGLSVSEALLREIAAL